MHLLSITLICAKLVLNNKYVHYILASNNSECFFHRSVGIIVNIKYFLHCEHAVMYSDEQFLIQLSSLKQEKSVSDNIIS